MTNPDHLTLPEEVMLLALREDTGTIEFGAWYQQAVAGAVLAEALLGARLRLVPDGKHSLVEVVPGDPTGNELVDEWLERIASDGKRRKVAHWTGKISGTKDLKARVAGSLVQRGILRGDHDKVMLLFTRAIYPEVDPQPERDLRERMHAAIFGDSSWVEPRTTALVSLAKGTGLLEVAFDKKELRARKSRIESLVEGELAGKAARELVTAISIAITTAVIVPIIIT